MSEFIDRSSAASWSDVEVENDTQTANNTFHDKYFMMFDEAFPLQRKKTKPTNLSKSWLTSGLANSMRLNSLILRII